MTIDCTNLKPGDKVRLRNGEIDVVAVNDGLSLPIRLEKCSDWYYPNGRRAYTSESEYDIVEILTNPKPEIDTTTFPFSWRYHLGTYVPPKDPNLCYPPLHKHTYTVSATTNEVVAITCDGKRFTPADSWPEPITDRLPTEKDANGDGDVQFLDSNGDWLRYPWVSVSKRGLGWLRTSDWKPCPIDKKTLTIRNLKEAMRYGENPDNDTLQSAIELLEAT
jgi:hypothetical protein